MDKDLIVTTEEENEQVSITETIGDMLIIPGQLASPQGLRDKTMKFTIYTQEMSPEKAGKLMTFNENFVWVALNHNTFRTEQVKLIGGLKAGAEIGKTPSERLRSVLFVLWKHRPEGYEDFNMYYEWKMNQIIDHFKSRLPQEQRPY